jgi:hypothetical protein
MRCATLIHRYMVLMGSIRLETTHTRHGNKTGMFADNQASRMSKEKNRANNVPLRATLLQTLRPPLAPNAQGLHNLLQQHHCLSQSRNPHHRYRPRPADYRKRRRGCLKRYWLARTSCRQHPRHRLWTLCLMSKTNKQDVYSLMNRRCAFKQSISRRPRKIVLADLVSPPSWSTVATSQMRRHLKTPRTGVF